VKTVLFCGNNDTPNKDLSGLWLMGAKRRDGKITGGEVINGLWDFRIRRGKFCVGQIEGGRFTCYDKYPIPEKMIEVQVDIKGNDYNEVIEAAREKLL